MAATAPPISSHMVLSVGAPVKARETYVDVELGPNMKVKAVNALLSDVVDPLTDKPADR